jgi:predicted 3-demethylubiquinone-9 3-methyltransferase (glyoxalase superfamily)
MKNIVPCLWFDTEGEAAAELYTSVFPNSKISMSRATERLVRGRREP